MCNRRHYASGLLIFLAIILMINPLVACQPGTPTVPPTETARTATEPEVTVTKREVAATEPEVIIIETEPVKPPPTPVFTCAPLKAQESGGFDPRSFALPERRGGLYLDGLVVVTGPSPGAIEKVMAQVLPTDEGSPPPPLDEIELGNLVIHIYEYPADAYPTVWDIVLAIYLISMQTGAEVYGDADYLLGDPWDIQGSPWDIQGSPWDIQGSPWDAIIQTGGSDIQHMFWKQWALEDRPYGIGTTGEGGTRIEVAVFDTSPFEAPGPYTFDLAQVDLVLCVSHPVPVVAPQGSDDYREHGLAVAGLAHAAAPQSTIHLVKVLNDHAEGDLFSLLKAISLYLQRTLDDRGSTVMTPGDTLANLVINLSLGFRPERSNPPPILTHLFDSRLPPAEYLDEYKEQLDEVSGKLGLEMEIQADALQHLRDQLELTEAPVPVPALRFLVRFATGHGAVVVAAAGNESPQVPAQLPACWPEVVGVGASNLPSSGQLPTHTCYSNQGDVYAPGGDGDESCQSQLQQCAAQPDTHCPYGVISLVTDPNASSPPAVGSMTQPAYAYWVGTSFSTPLTSGLVALHLQDGTSPHDMLASLQGACQAGTKPGVVGIQ